MRSNDYFIDAKAFLSRIGCRWKTYQENKRELWKLDGVDIAIDEWPFLEPFVELEGKSENAVRRVSKKLGFDYKTAVFGATGKLISIKYGISENFINNTVPYLTFKGRNPYLKEARRVSKSKA